MQFREGKELNKVVVGSFGPSVGSFGPTSYKEQVPPGDSTFVLGDQL